MARPGLQSPPGGNVSMIPTTAWRDPGSPERSAPGVADPSVSSVASGRPRVAKTEGTRRRRGRPRRARRWPSGGHGRRRSRSRRCVRQPSRSASFSGTHTACRSTPSATCSSNDSRPSARSAAGRAIASSAPASRSTGGSAPSSARSSYGESETSPRRSLRRTFPIIVLGSRGRNRIAKGTLNRARFLWQ
jgi:hypothetical protein